MFARAKGKAAQGAEFAKGKAVQGAALAKEKASLGAEKLSATQLDVERKKKEEEIRKILEAEGLAMQTTSSPSSSTQAVAATAGADTVADDTGGRTEGDAQYSPERTASGDDLGPAAGHVEPTASRASHTAPRPALSHGPRPTGHGKRKP